MIWICDICGCLLLTKSGYITYLKLQIKPIACSFIPAPPLSDARWKNMRVVQKEYLVLEAYEST